MAAKGEKIAREKEEKKNNASDGSSSLSPSVDLLALSHIARLGGDKNSAASIKPAGSQHCLISSIQVLIALYRITAHSGRHVFAARNSVAWDGRKQLSALVAVAIELMGAEVEMRRLPPPPPRRNLIRSCFWCINFVMEKLPWGLSVN